MEEKKIKTVTVTLTQSCNLACVYCYEHYKSIKKMDIETAKRIIDFELANSSEYDGIEFDLFGGEPFLVFDLLKAVTEYICEKKGTMPCTVFATTNGTLIHGEIQTWLENHSGCFICGLSLDGTREMHNLNRSNSYDSIDLPFFLRLYPDQDVKMTISQETLPNLAEGVIDMHRKGFLVSCNLAFGIDWSNPNNVSVLNRELMKLIEFYLENPTIEPCSMLEMGFNNVAHYENTSFRFCGAGKSMRAYDVDGQAYPCQFFMPLSVGPEKAKTSQTMVFPKDVIRDDLLDEKCRKCVIQSACPNCFGANYAASGNIYYRDDNMCRLTKIMLKARSYFRGKQWELGQLDQTLEDLPVLLKAIVMIQEKLEV